MNICVKKMHDENFSGFQTVRTHARTIRRFASNKSGGQTALTGKSVLRKLFTLSLSTHIGVTESWF